MAHNTNQVFLTGNLTRDPELRTSKGGTSVVNIGIANNRYGGKDKDDRVNFIDCVAFGKRGEAIAEYFKKGSPILIDGELSFNSWEDAEGNKRSKIEVLINGFEFIGGNKKDGEGGNSKPKAKAKANGGGSNDDDDDGLF